jgi:Zn2+/Cd2+-exporting ATPase
MVHEHSSTHEKDPPNKETASNVAGHSSHKHDEDGNEVHDDDDGHDHDSENESSWKRHWPLLTSLGILGIMLALEFGFKFKPRLSADLLKSLRLKP